MKFEQTVRMFCVQFEGYGGGGGGFDQPEAVLAVHMGPHIHAADGESKTDQDLQPSMGDARQP